MKASHSSLDLVGRTTAPDILKSIDQQLHALGVLHESGIVSGSLADDARQAWGFTRRHGWDLRIVFEVNAPGAPCGVRVAAQRGSHSTLQPLFWFRFRGDEAELCSRYLPRLIGALQEIAEASEMPAC